VLAAPALTLLDREDLALDQRLVPGRSVPIGLTRVRSW